MTAMTVPARPEHDARLRPVPWRRMAWVTWRQHRAPDLPVRLDPGLRPVALDARQAGAARGRACRCRRGIQPAVELVLPAVLRRGQPGCVTDRADPFLPRPV